MKIGFTTGSAASAAAKAAIYSIAGRKNIKAVDIPLPDGSRMNIPISSVILKQEEAIAEVIKDAGDDPDVTHKAKIVAKVRLIKGRGKGVNIKIRAGKGVGIVTKPGLAVPIGEPAINPVPKMQIKSSVYEALNEMGLSASEIVVTIEVPDGEKIAKKTLNPKLGIINGISILGTRGTVIPFSNEAYKKTIEIEMDVAVSNKQDTIVLSTGGRSEKFAKKIYKELDEICFIQVADFFAFSLKEARKRGFSRIIYNCFFGKLLKIAQGNEYTHAKVSEIDFSLLADWCSCFGLSRNDLEKIRNANTASQALDIIRVYNSWDKIISFIMKNALFYARRHAGQYPEIVFNLFDMDGNLLYQEKEHGSAKKDQDYRNRSWKN